MRAPKIVCLIAMLSTLLVAGNASAEDGLQVGTYNLAESWSRLQGRLMLGVSATPAQDALDASPARLTSVSLLGDYYLSRPIGTRAGGVRATSGLLAGPRAAMWGSLSTGGAFQIERRPGVGSYLADGDRANANTVPYLGIGYTGLSLRDGWGVSVDVGLMALRPRSAGQLGNVLNGSQNLDGMLRDMQLSPILQLGISYAF